MQKAGTWIPRTFGRDAIRNRNENALLKEIKKQLWGLEGALDLKSFICEEAPQLCVMLIFWRHIGLIEQFYKCGIKDRDFPLEVSSREETQTEIKHPKATLNISFENSITLLDHYQWRFFVPSLSWKAFDGPALPRETILPYLTDLVEISRTDFSIVHKTTIHRDHIDMRSNHLKLFIGDNGNPVAAVKELLPIAMTNDQFESFIKYEYDFLNKLRGDDFQTKHLIKATASYRYKDTLYFVFPWASQGNLRKFWKEKVPQVHDKTFLKWLFAQLLGVAETIQSLHKPQVNIRHGDLKPENILCFESSDPFLDQKDPSYVLVISDVGLAREHDKLTKFRSRTKQPGGGTMVYAGPEMELSEGRATSRRYDIWSLGCIYLEFFIWLLYGIDGLEQFDKAKNGKFYRVREKRDDLQPGGTVKTAEINPVVLDWIARAIEHSRDATADEESAVSRLLTLIKDRLLVIDANPDTLDSSSNGTVPVQGSPAPISESSNIPDIRLERSATVLERTVISERAYAEEVYTEILEIVRSAEAHEIEWVVLEELMPAMPDPPHDLDQLDPNGPKLDDRWEYIPDNAVAKKLLESPLPSIASLYTLPRGAKCFDYNIQLGYPKLSDPGDRWNVAVIDAWLQDCDETHECLRIRDKSFLPTRLLDVGLDSTNCRLICHTARKLGIHFLWIDSLCIIQPEPGNHKDRDKGQDFRRESNKMELVFSSAYATIAATCASSAAERFLKPRPKRQFVTIQTESSPCYLAEVIDEFSKEVDSGGLNNRGWVFQERALSRRTIYFAEQQTYWECGQGVRSETLSRTMNIRGSILGDANFPYAFLTFDKGKRIKLYQDLYERYTRLALTHSTDRPVAIKGMEARLLHALETRGGFGVFEVHLHRGLLWKREGPRLARIDYSKGSTRAAREIIPSWSWMAYDGAIRYMDIPPGAEWKAWYANVTSPWERVHDYNGRQPSELRVLARNIVDFAAGDRVFLDEPHSAAGHDFKCVVVGSRRAPNPMRAEEYYSLIVTLLDGEEDVCQRAGVAFLDRRHIDWDTPAVALRVR
ncbi:serine/threonine protein kinase-44 [Seiridium cupressi]